MRRRRFTILHGFAWSLALHSAFCAPFVLHGLASPPQAPSTLVVELRGVIADSQAAQQVRRETKEDAQPTPTVAAEPVPQAKPAPPEPPAETAAAAATVPAPPPKPTPALPPRAVAKTAPRPGTGRRDRSGTDTAQVARTIAVDRDQADRLKDYVKLLAAKIQANLVYPPGARQARLEGTATVSFTILPSGELEPNSLRIVASSGQPALDDSALRTVRSSVPFDPPPKLITVTIGVAFGPQP